MEGGLSPPYNRGRGGGSIWGCLRGSSGVRDKELEAALVGRGWVVDDSVTKATTLLIIADEGAETVKVKKARAAGVRIVGLTAARLLR